MGYFPKMKVSEQIELCNSLCDVVECASYIRYLPSSNRFVGDDEPIVGLVYKSSREWWNLLVDDGFVEMPE